MCSMETKSWSGKQPGHFRHGGVENVEHELRRDADCEHEQRHGNHDAFLASPKIRKRVAISARGPLKSDCIIRMK